MLQEIIYHLGHDIGLHFDEKVLEGGGDRELVNRVQEEANTLQDLLKILIRSVSMHRPSPTTLAADYHFEGLVNTYGKLFFEEFKYIFDSRRNWRENSYDVFSCGKDFEVQMLIHPFSYTKTTQDTKKVLRRFIDEAKMERYSAVN
ncbi:MAG TPA: hypothetical protein GXZ91_08105 [Christensenellaceae bacterium]|jgi:hypothetical protein|nr:hypothetical protein [Christensenellaceae bacterium]